ncbi:hypothetical protein CKA32_003411 [Geitlerinema sp. FC II]|nr:hypothetical protein CKA32_003411 [Geitlerinema sp. FC II]
MTDRSVSRSTPDFSSHAPYDFLFPVPRSPFPVYHHGLPTIVNPAQ